MIRTRLACALAVLLVSGRGLDAFGQQHGVLSIRGDRFLLDGEPIELWGIRVGSATMNDAICQHLIDQLSE